MASHCLKRTSKTRHVLTPWHLFCLICHQWFPQSSAPATLPFLLLFEEVTQSTCMRTFVLTVPWASRLLPLDIHMAGSLPSFRSFLKSHPVRASLVTLSKISTHPFLKFQILLSIFIFLFSTYYCIVEYITQAYLLCFLSPPSRM